LSMNPSHDLNRTHRYIAPMFFADLKNSRSEKLFANRQIVERPRYYVHQNRKDVIVCVMKVLDAERFDSSMKELRNDSTYVSDKMVKGDFLRSIVVLKTPAWIRIDKFLEGKYSQIATIKIQKAWFPDSYLREYRVMVKDPKLVEEIAKALDVDPSIIGEMDEIPRLEEEVFNYQPTPTP